MGGCGEYKLMYIFRSRRAEILRYGLSSMAKPGIHNGDDSGGQYYEASQLLCGCSQATREGVDLLYLSSFQFEW